MGNYKSDSFLATLRFIETRNSSTGAACIRISKTNFLISREKNGGGFNDYSYRWIIVVQITALEGVVCARRFIISREQFGYYVEKILSDDFKYYLSTLHSVTLKSEQILCIVCPGTIAVQKYAKFSCFLVHFYLFFLAFALPFDTTTFWEDFLWRAYFKFSSLTYPFNIISHCWQIFIQIPTSFYQNVFIELCTSLSQFPCTRRFFRLFVLYLNSR